MQGIHEPPFLLISGDEYDAWIAKSHRTVAHFTAARKLLLTPGGRIADKVDGKLTCRAPCCITRPRYQAISDYADTDLRLETISVDLKIAREHGHPWCPLHKPSNGVLCADEAGAVCSCCARAVAVFQMLQGSSCSALSKVAAQLPYGDRKTLSESNLAALSLVLCNRSADVCVMARHACPGRPDVSEDNHTEKRLGKTTTCGTEAQVRPY
jgi:hypothetical protein